MHRTTSGEFRKPSVDILCHSLLLVARIGNIPGLVCELWAIASIFTTAFGVHSSLQCITFPTKNVITMLTVSRFVTSAENERLRAVFGPNGPVIELPSVPYSLV
jgi:hypothetical protein